MNLNMAQLQQRVKLQVVYFIFFLEKASQKSTLDTEHSPPLVSNATATKGNKILGSS